MAPVVNSEIFYVTVMLLLTAQPLRVYFSINGAKHQKKFVYSHEIVNGESVNGLL